MNQRGISTLGAVVLAGLMGVATAAVVADWVVVDVQTLDEDAVHVIVPMPLVAADLALAFVPDEVFDDATLPPEVAANRDAILGAVRALADAPDATLVKVDSPDAVVEIAKHGSQLTVVVDADDARVRCAIPIDGVRDALEKWDWQRLDPRLLVDIVHAARPGTLVRVEAEDARVAVLTW